MKGDASIVDKTVDTVKKFVRLLNKVLEGLYFAYVKRKVFATYTLGSFFDCFLCSASNKHLCTFLHEFLSHRCPQTSATTSDNYLFPFEQTVGQQVGDFGRQMFYGNTLEYIKECALNNGFNMHYKRTVIILILVLFS